MHILPCHAIYRNQTKNVSFIPAPTLPRKETRLIFHISFTFSSIGLYTELPSPQGAAVGMAAALSGVAFVAPGNKSSGTVRTPALRGQVQSNAQAAGKRLIP